MKKQNQRTSNFQYDVFLSHSAKDGEFVSQLATSLAEAGLRVWYDRWNIRVGASFIQGIVEAIKDSRFLLVVMSPDYFQSRWTQQEMQYAFGNELETGEIRLIPLLYRDCEIPLFLQSKVLIDFRNPAQYRIVLDCLVRDLKSLTSRQVESISHLDTEAPKSEERMKNLDPSTISQLQKVLNDAVEAFRTKPDTDVNIATDIRSTDVEDDLCFIMMPFSIESLNIVYEDFVKPILTDRCHLRVQRGDDVFGSNVIMDDISNSIRKARLIIADLTARNANVFYEVGIAHALNKQVLLMTQSIDDVPFDLRHRRALVYEYSPRGYKKLENDLYANVQNMLGNRSKI